MSDSYSKSVVSGIRYKYNKIYIGQEVQLAADFIWYRNNIPPEKNRVEIINNSNVCYGGHHLWLDICDGLVIIVLAAIVLK